MSSLYTSLSLAALTLVLASCGNGDSAGTADTVPARTDSAVPPMAREVVPQRLPDTAYASAAKVKYTVEVLDSLPGRVDNLANAYAHLPGVLTFRGGPARSASFGGTVSAAPTGFNIDWTYTTPTDNRDTGHGRWGGGTGWTGQPLYIAWPDSCVRRLKKAGAVNENFTGTEVIVGSLSSRVCFMDWATGRPTREPLFVGNPVKGTVSLDPALNGNLYVGHGVPAQRPWGARVVDLYSNSVTKCFDEDPKALRRWFAFDSSPLRVGQFVFRPGENGSVYKCTASPGSMEIHSVLRYTVNGTAPGIESSMAVYANYGYLCDNHGNVVCINLDTLRPVWHASTGDDTDATPVVEVEDGTPYLYVGCEIDRTAAGTAKFMKINGIDGSVVWTSQTPGKRMEIGDKHFDGGYYASALPGTGDCRDLIFSNCVTNLHGQSGELMAFARKDGTVRYRTPLKVYSWSSPVAFTTPAGKMYIVTGDARGYLYLIEGCSGQIIATQHVGSNFESSPVVHGNALVVGSRGDKIYKVSLTHAQ